MSSNDPRNPQQPEHNSRRMDATRDATGADASPEIELRHGHEYTAAEVSGPPDEIINESGRGRSGGRKACASCLIIFVVLAAIAALGTWLTQRSGSITVSVPNIPHLPSVDLPTFRYPDFSSLPPNQPGVQPPTIMSPQPTPHPLPDDLDGVLQTLEPVMRERFQEHVESAGVNWPPKRVRLVGLKMEKRLEVWAANENGPYSHVKTYPMFAASGELGPKRRQGDKQVPEGHYRLVHLNPQSKFHLSLLLDYPNAADKSREAMALADGADLGGDICVHGSATSIGCIAIGDPAIEEVFTLVALADAAHRDIVIMPADLRKRPDLITLAGEDASLHELYGTLVKAAETVSPSNDTVTAAN